jgi:hypothetical protein
MAQVLTMDVGQTGVIRPDTETGQADSPQRDPPRCLDCGIRHHPGQAPPREKRLDETVSALGPICGCGQQARLLPGVTLAEYPNDRYYRCDTCDLEVWVTQDFGWVTYEGPPVATVPFVVGNFARLDDGHRFDPGIPKGRLRTGSTRAPRCA